MHKMFHPKILRFTQILYSIILPIFREDTERESGIIKLLFSNEKEVMLNYFFFLILQ